MYNIENYLFKCLINKVNLPNMYQIICAINRKCAKTYI